MALVEPFTTVNEGVARDDARGKGNRPSSDEKGLNPVRNDGTCDKYSPLADVATPSEGVNFCQGILNFLTGRGFYPTLSIGNEIQIYVIPAINGGAF